MNMDTVWHQTKIHLLKERMDIFSLVRSQLDILIRLGLQTPCGIPSMFENGAI